MKERDNILKACSEGATKKLQERLSIYFSQPSESFEASLINDMLAESTQNDHAATVRYILTLDRKLDLSEDKFRQAFSSGSNHTYTALMMYKPNIIYMSIYNGREI